MIRITPTPALDAEEIELAPVNASGPGRRRLT